VSRLPLSAVCALALGACALKGDVRRVEDQVAQLRLETARADSARAASLQRLLDEVSDLQTVVLDSLAAQQRRLALSQGELRGDLTDVQQQLVQIQELMGQSQQRLSELRGQIEQRREAAAVAGGDTSGARAPSAEPGAEQLYDLAVRQLRAGSPGTARQALYKLLQDYPQHDRVPDALFQLGESWAGSNADSAAHAYERVAREYPNSPRAPTALYKLGLMAERRGDRRAAQVYYQRVVAGYPHSEEAALARSKLSGRGG
jgi:tol-pal system protein YbgF